MLSDGLRAQSSPDKPIHQRTGNGARPGRPDQPALTRPSPAQPSLRRLPGECLGLGRPLFPALLHPSAAVCLSRPFALTHPYFLLPSGAVTPLLVNLEEGVHFFFLEISEP